MRKSIAVGLAVVCAFAISGRGMTAPESPPSASRLIDALRSIPDGLDSFNAVDRQLAAALLSIGRPEVAAQLAQAEPSLSLLVV